MDHYLIWLTVAYFCSNSYKVMYPFCLSTLTPLEQTNSENLMTYEETAQCVSNISICNKVVPHHFYAEPHSSVGSITDLRTVRWFHPLLRQYPFRGLMIVIATGFIPLSPLSVVSSMVMKAASGLEKYCVENWLKELQETMDRCTGHKDKMKYS